MEPVEKERALLERLDRIDGLRSEDAPATVLLDEVRSLLAEAEAWAQEDPRERSRALDAIEQGRDALAAGEEASRPALART